MSQSLCFNDFTFSPVIRDNQPWFRSSEIARALGYKREDKIAQIYPTRRKTSNPRLMICVLPSVPRRRQTG